MSRRLLVSLVALVAAIGAIVLAWPQLVGLQDQIVFAQLVAFRAVLALSAIGIAVVLALLLLVRPLRPLAAALGVVVVLFAAANVAILAGRGLAGSGADPASATASTEQTTTGETVTVLSWNTLGGQPGADVVADLALEHGADIVSLPETTDAFATEVAELMRAGGSPMWAYGLSFSEIYEARSTALLISPDLGDYTLQSAGGTGPPGNTNVSPTVVAAPISGEGPTIVAVHAVSPLRGEMGNWRSDLDWLAQQCDGGSVIMAGDFNATIDHMAGRGTDGGQLGECADAALQEGAAAIGTWPSSTPALLGAPIDHVMATADWTPSAFEVITSLDDLGSDHRPIVTTLTRG
ncbi:MAG: endonuclease/exonuclease/phosphatase family protein [Leifsonia sp.]